MNIRVKVDHSSADPLTGPKKKKPSFAMQPNTCFVCFATNYDDKRIESCRMCGSKLKRPAGWELSGTDPYGYTRSE